MEQITNNHYNFVIGYSKQVPIAIGILLALTLRYDMPNIW